jgi:hypothetical protein
LLRKLETGGDSLILSTYGLHRIFIQFNTVNNASHHPG